MRPTNSPLLTLINALPDTALRPLVLALLDSAAPAAATQARASNGSAAPHTARKRSRGWHDGFRLMAFRAGDRVRLYTRNGHDWSSRYPLVLATMHGLRVRSCLIDGEIVVTRHDRRFLLRPPA
jgi:ATP-dependent DNA ligase